MEIERKWMVDGWPCALEACQVWNMEQGYISVKPTVRIRKEELVGVKCEYILCFKGAPSEGGLQREEIETPIEEELFNKLKNLIGLPLIMKERRVYKLESGKMLEVNSVDPDLDSAYCYAEVEFDTVEDAKNWKPSDDGIEDFLSDECTGKPGSSMGAYWRATRLNK